MQCQRCGHEFTVINPDKVEAVQKKAVATKEKQGKNAEYRRHAAQMKAECLARNGKIEPNENLLAEIGYFGFHKNSFYTSNGKLRITDRAYVWFNENGSFRIPKSEVVSVKKKNYMGVIPTGVQIRTTYKRRKYDFVVFAKEREHILQKLE